MPYTFIIYILLHEYSFFIQLGQFYVYITLMLQKNLMPGLSNGLVIGTNTIVIDS